MKRKIFVIAAALSIFVLLAVSQMKDEPFALAEDFPRGALVYAQINDLPAAIKLWNESDFKEKYSTSESFADFQNRHLGRKLLSRWREFNEAAGFEFDLETIASLVETGAAIAVYDIGRLEFVFVAPVSDEVFAATKFALNREKFAEETLEGGTKIYRAAVRADRGRQRQELIFTNLKNRLVLATSEKLLAQTLKNIGGASEKNRLRDEPSFKELSEKTAPHLATVWASQTLLNEDYYFRRYWLMSDAADLKNIRAGMFDFEIGDGKLIERRRFLLAAPENVSAINPQTAKKMLALVSAEIPFYNLRSSNPRTVAETVRKTIFDRRADTENFPPRREVYYSSDDYGDVYDWHDYSHSDENFDENVDEIEDEEDYTIKRTAVDFAKNFTGAQPQAVLTFTKPEIKPAPLFVEFRRAAVFHLAAPGKFDRDEFEAAIAREFSAQVLIAAPETGFVWQSKSENNSNWRELNLPLTGWNASYILRGNELILTDDRDFLREIIETAEAAAPPKNFEKSFAELKVLNLERRETDFTDIFGEFAEKKIADSFFTENVGSLLDSLAEIKRIEASRRFMSEVLEEETVAYLKDAP
jgi:hypothetical protein